jgi:stress response protein SCP2
METRLEKEVRLLKAYAFIATVLCGVLVLSAFAFQNKKQKFEEIDVQRINVVEKDGKLRMVISNKERQTPVIVDGKTFPQEGRSAGLIFFNEKGDEVGGLTIKGDTGEGQYNSFTFDKFRGDQTIALQHLEDSKGEYYAGLAVNDVNLPTTELVSKLEAIKQLPTEAARNGARKEMMERGEFMVTRLMVGRGRNKSALIILRDAKGKPRITMSVSAEGTPKLEFLDAGGKVIQTLPDAPGK